LGNSVSLTFRASRYHFYIFGNFPIDKCKQIFESKIKLQSIGNTVCSVTCLHWDYCAWVLTNMCVVISTCGCCEIHAFQWNVSGFRSSYLPCLK